MSDRLQQLRIELLSNRDLHCVKKASDDSEHLHSLMSIVSFPTNNGAEVLRRFGYHQVEAHKGEAKRSCREIVYPEVSAALANQRRRDESLDVDETVLW
jgi:hypothetical protein